MNRFYKKISALLLIALLAGEFQVPTYASINPTDGGTEIMTPTSYNVITEPDATTDTVSDTTTEPNPTSGTNPTNPVETDPVIEPVTDPEGTVSTDTVTEDTVSAGSVPQASVSDDEVEYTIIEGVFPQQTEAHGASPRLRSFANQSRTPFYINYRNQLSDGAKKIYDNLVANIDNTRSGTYAVVTKVFSAAENGGHGIDISTTEKEKAYFTQLQQDYLTAYAAFDMDHPEVYWIAANKLCFGYSYSTDGAGNLYELTLTIRAVTTAEYAENGGNYFIDAYTSKAAVEADQRVIDENVQSILSSIPENANQYEKLVKINDWLVEHNYYNSYVAENNETGATQKAWEISGALTNREGTTDPNAPVCESYSRAFKYLCDQVDIPCTLVFGAGHMWNYVQLSNGEWYAVDTTWNDPVSNMLDYPYPEFDTDVNRAYLMVGSKTKQMGDEAEPTFIENHPPNGIFWLNGYGNFTEPILSETRYDTSAYFSPTISDLSLTMQDDFTYQATFTSDQIGTYYFLVRPVDEEAPSTYDMERICTTEAERESELFCGSGPAQIGENTFSVGDFSDTPCAEYTFYLLQLDAVEHISELTSYRWEHGIPLTSIETPEELRVSIARGERRSMSVNLLPINTTDPHTMYWESSDPDVLYIDSSTGRVTAREVGEATISVRPQKDYSTPDDPYPISANALIQVVYPSGWFEENGNTYYGDENGLLLKGYQYLQDRDASEEKLVNYYFDPEDGRMLTGFHRTEDGVLREFGPDGKEIYHDEGTVNGFVTINGHVYFYENGEPVKSAVKDINGKSYCFDAEGVMHADGWFELEGKQYYANEEGVLLEGVQIVSGVKYYFSMAADERANAENKRFSLYSGVKELNGKSYLYTESGMQVGYVEYKGLYYYADTAAATLGVLKSGWVKVNDEWRLFSTANYGEFSATHDGNWVTVSINELPYTYYFRNNASLLRGWQTVDGRTYFFENDGYVKTGFFTQSNKTYYLCEGPMNDLLMGGTDYRLGARFTGYTEIDGHHYLFNQAGVMQYGWQRVLCPQGENIWMYQWCYFDMETGIQQQTSAVENHYGWYTLSMNGITTRHYFRNDTARVTGWQTIDGGRYYFDPTTGAVQTGFVKIGNSGYYFAEDQNQWDYGMLRTGSFSVGEGDEEKFYYANSAGVLQLGWQKINGNWFYFDRNRGYMCDANIAQDYWADVSENGIYYFRNGTSMVTGFQTIDGNYYYFSTNAQDGSLGQLQKGFFDVGKNRYYADENGVVQKGLCKIGGGENDYYFFNTNYTLATGWVRIDNKQRYFRTLADLGDSDDATLLGKEIPMTTTDNYWYVNAVDSENTKIRYYFINSVTLAKGWQTIDGKRYYFSTNAQDGTLGQLCLGEYKIGNSYYYFEPEDTTNLGVMLANAWRQDSNTLNWYYYNASGVRMSGWQTINGSRYYFDPATGIKQTGILQIGTTKYLLGVDGILQKGYYVLEGISDDDNGTYFANNSGVLQYGWQKIDGLYRFFDFNTGKEATSTIDGDYFATIGEYKYYLVNGTTMATGFRDINGARYYFEPQKGESYGRMKKSEFFNVGINTYYADANGVLQKGYVQIEEYHYFFDNNYIMKTLWHQINGVWRYFEPTPGADYGKENDQIRPNTPIAGLYQVVDFENYKTFYFINDVLQTGWKDINGTRYYFNADSKVGPLGEMQTGLFTIGRNSFYTYTAEESGHPMGSVYSGFLLLTIDGVTNTYYFNASGQMMKGWQTIDGKSYYFDTTTGAMQTGRTLIGNTYYYLGMDGMRQTGFVTDNGSTYYFNTNGTMFKGWLNLGGYRYYFDADGILKTGFTTVGKAVYYFEENPSETGFPLGAMRTGVLSLGNHEHRETYYLSNAGVMLYGWQKIDGIWRYFAYEQDAELYGATLGKEYTTDFAGGNDWSTVNFGGAHTGETYYFINGVSLARGWQNIEGYRYYFDPTSGVMQTGLITIGRNEFYLCTEGDSVQYDLPVGTVYSGFKDVDNGEFYRRMYFNASGQSLIGWQTINGKRYYFDQYNGMAIGPWTLSGKFYFFDADVNGNYGAMLTGYYEVAGGDGVPEGWAGKYYSNTAGLLQTGWQKINGEWHYFMTMEDGSYSSGNVFAKESNVTWNGFWATVETTQNKYYFTNGTNRCTGWQNIDGKRYYFYPNGSLCTGEWEGYAYIGNKEYRFRDDGSLVTGFDTEAGMTFYYNANGIRLTGWQTIDGKRYYFDPAGGRMYAGYEMIGSSYYLFSNDGVLQTGYVSYTPSGSEDTQHYFLTNSGVMQFGWQKVNGEWKYFMPYSGNEIVGATIGADYWARANGYSYYFINGTTMATGWQTIDGKRYYFETDRSKPTYGSMYIGDLFIGGAKYFTDMSGAMENGFIPRGANQYSYYDQNGRMLTGWVTVNGARYYINANGYVYTGLTRVGNTTYYFNEEWEDLNGQQCIGRMMTGEISVYAGGEPEQWESKYYANASGVLLSGWQKVNGEWRYYSPLTFEWNQSASVDDDFWARVYDGEAFKYYYFLNGTTIVKGWQVIQGKRYYFDQTGLLQECDAEGRLYVGTTLYNLNNNDYDYMKYAVAPGWRDYSNGSTKYFDANGKICIGWQTINGARYYFDHVGDRKIGFFNIGSNLYYANEPGGDAGETGKVQTGWFTVDGKTYYANSGFAILKNWQTIAGKRYYFNPADGARAEGFLTIGTNCYFFDADGVMQKDIVHNNGKTFYLNSAGVVQTGWQKVSNRWRYFLTQEDIRKENKEGQLLGEERAGTITNDYWASVSINGINQKYYMRNNGSVVKGWQSIKDASTQKNERFYFDAAGVLQTPADGLLLVNGVWFHVDPASGRALSGIHQVSESSKLPDGTYFFNANGQMTYGWVTVTESGISKKYYMNMNGRALKGISYIGNTRYYFDNDGVLLQNYMTDSFVADSYRTDRNGVVLCGFMKDGDVWRYFDKETGREQKTSTPCATDSNWVTVDTGKYKGHYYFINGKTMATGWKTINCYTTEETDPQTYYFDANGIMQFGELVIGKNRYRMLDDIDGGYRITGWWSDDPTTFENGNIYYYSENSRNAGLMLFGWQSIKDASTGKTDTYYFDAAGVRQTGIIKIGNARYYLNEAEEDGYPIGARRIGYVENAGDTENDYFCNNSGVMQYGWQYVTNSDNTKSWRYFDTTTGIEASATNDAGWYTVTGAAGEEKYYFINGTKLAKGWVNIAENGITKKYYFDAQTGILQTGETVINRVKYFLNDDGSVFSGFRNVTAGRLYYDANGKQLFGWQNIKDTSDNKTYRYYFEPTTGVMAVGQTQIGTSVYFFSDESDSTRGRMQTGVINQNGTRYYYNTSGVMQKGFFVVKDDMDTVARIHYFSYVDGKMSGYVGVNGNQMGSNVYAVQDEAYNTLGSTYFCLRGTTPLKGYQNVSCTVNGRNVTMRKYFDAKTGVLQFGDAITNIIVPGAPDEQLQTGLFRIGTDVVCVNHETGEVYNSNLAGNGPKEITAKMWETAGISKPSGYYFFNADGKMVTGWVTWNGDRYYFSPIDGHMYTGSQMIGNVGYYFLEGELTIDEGLGTMHVNGWVQEEYQDGGGFHNAYYYNAKGQLLKGWQNIVDPVSKKTYTYYFDPITGKLWTGMRTIANKTYYLNDMEAATSATYGARATNTRLRLNDGGMYSFDASGVMQKGFLKIKEANETVARLRYFSLKDGKEYPVASLETERLGLNSYSNANVVSVLDAGMGSRAYFYLNNTSPRKGYQNVVYKNNATNVNVTLRQYFDPTTGILQTGLFKVGADVVCTDDATGAIYNSTLAVNGPKYITTEMWRLAGISKPSSHYFFNADGKMVTGWVTWDKSRYYFSPIDGHMYTGSQMIGNVGYYFEEGPADCGKMRVNGWVQKDYGTEGGVRNAYYYNANGQLLKGWQNIKDTSVTPNVTRTYYFDPITGELQTGFKTIANKTYYLNNQCSASIPEYGARATNARVPVGEGMYSFDTAGVMQKGFFKIKEANETVARLRYFSLKDGKEYSVDSLEVERLGFNNYSNANVVSVLDVGMGSRAYFYLNNTSPRKGYQNVVYKNNDTDANVTLRQYFDTTTGILQTGLFKAGADVVCADQATGEIYNSTLTGNGPKQITTEMWESAGINKPEGYYFFNSDGKMMTGWISWNKNRYYFSPVDGHMYTGSRMIGNVGYYFNEAPATSERPYGAMSVNDWMQKDYDPTEGDDFRNAYYYNANGQLLKGWQNIKDTTVIPNVTRTYYFDPITGELQTGFKTIANKTYYLNDQGSASSAAYGARATNARVSVGEGIYSFDTAGVMQKGFFKIKDESGIAKLHYFSLVDGKECLVNDLSSIYHGNTNWISVEDAKLNNPAFYLSGTTPLRGYQNITYTIEGKRVTKRYYFDKTTGALQRGGINDTENGLFKLGQDVICVYDATGEIYNSTLAGNGPKQITTEMWEAAGINKSEGYYFFNSDGKMMTGWISWNKNRYYFSPIDGHMYTGSQMIGNVGYYFNEDSSTSERAYGAMRVNDWVNAYYYNANGQLLKGWQNIKDTTVTPNVTYTYYFDPITGELQTGWNTIANKTYYLNNQGSANSAAYGARATNARVIVEGNKYSFDTSGVMQRGFFKIKETNETAARLRYFSLKDGKEYAVASLDEENFGAKQYSNAGVYSVADTGMGSRSYFYLNNTTPRKGYQNVVYIDKADNDKKVTLRQYFDSSTGILQTGLFRIGADIVCADNTTGEIYNSTLTTKGPKQINEETWTAAGIDKPTGYYFFNVDGKMVTGWITWNAKKYYFSPTTGKMATGIMTIGKEDYYFADDGTLYTGGIVELGDKKYGFSNTGVMLIGWQTIDGEEYFFDTTGVMQTGFMTSQNNRYYFSEEAASYGQMAKSGFFQVTEESPFYDDSENASNTYYARSNGPLVIGLSNLGWNQLVADANVKDSQRWLYYCDPVPGATQGQILTGEVMIDGVNYLFDEDTGYRRKIVLYFHGGYYGKALSSADCAPQTPFMDAIARYINPKNTFATEHTSSPNQLIYTTSGNKYPLAASSYVKSEFQWLNYVVANDTVSYNVATGTYEQGKDGAVDVGDVEAYSWERYQYYINTYGAQNIVLVGASSGGGIALALLQKAKANNFPLASETILLSPWLDVSMSNPGAQMSPSITEYVDYASLAYWGARYTRDADYATAKDTPYIMHEDGHHVDAIPAGTKVYEDYPGPGTEYAFASPLLQGNPFEGLSNITIFTGTYDNCYADCVSAKQAGGDAVTLYTYDKQLHGYMFDEQNAASKDTAEKMAWIITTEAGGAY